MNELVYLIDVDGTLADLSHRLHFIQKRPADWDGFFAACPGDLPINNVITTVRCLGHHAKLIGVSGRSDAIREQTLIWLKKHGVELDELYMRKAGDHRHDDIVKSELLDEILKHNTVDDIAGVFEDRNAVVEMYRKRGLTVFQVADGNF